jgi:hypothetical protein
MAYSMKYFANQYDKKLIMGTKRYKFLQIFFKSLITWISFMSWLIHLVLQSTFSGIRYL